MCLTIVSPFSTDPLIAENDIEILKVILRDDEKDDVYFTPYQHYQLTFDEEGKCEIKTTRLTGEYSSYAKFKCVNWDTFFWTLKDGAVKKDVSHRETASKKFPIYPIDCDYEALHIYEGVHGWMTRASAERMRCALSNIDTYNKLMAYGGMRMKYCVIDPTTSTASIHLYPIAIVKAVVPKGSMYFLGDGTDIVADKMIIFKPE